MLIGLTGQIGAGKSTAARILHDFGACIINADLIGKQVVDQNPALLKRLAIRFGEEILTTSGKLNRKALALRAFTSDENKAALDRLVHPYLLKVLRGQIRELRGCEVIVIDAALLLNWELDKVVDHVLVVTASQSNRIERMQRRGYSREEVLARQKNQLPLSEYKRRATHVVPNNGTEDDLRRRLFRLWQRWNSETD